MGVLALRFVPPFALPEPGSRDLTPFFEPRPEEHLELPSSSSSASLPSDTSETSAALPRDVFLPLPSRCAAACVARARPTDAETTPPRYPLSDDASSGPESLSSSPVPPERPAPAPASARLLEAATAFACSLASSRSSNFRLGQSFPPSANQRCIQGTGGGDEPPLGGSFGTG